MKSSKAETSVGKKILGSILRDIQFQDLEEKKIVSRRIRFDETQVKKTFIEECHNFWPNEALSFTVKSTCFRSYFIPPWHLSALWQW